MKEEIITGSSIIDLSTQVNSRITAINASNIFSVSAITIDAGRFYQVIVYVI